MVYIQNGAKPKSLEAAIPATAAPAFIALTLLQRTLSLLSLKYVRCQGL